jgi:hypothetical protein
VSAATPLQSAAASPAPVLAPAAAPAWGAHAAALAAGAAVAAAPAPAAPLQAAAAVPGAPSAAKDGKPKFGLANAVGLVLGLGISRFFGAAMIFPALFGGIAAVVLTKAGPARARPFVGAASAIIGHLGWMVAAGLILRNFGPVAIDLVLMGAGVAWLLAAPGLAPAIALGVFEVVGIVVNLGQLSEAGGAMQKALVLHVLLRAGAIAGLVWGQLAFRKAADRLPVASTARVFE